MAIKLQASPHHHNSHFLWITLWVSFRTTSRYPFFSAQLLVCIKFDQQRELSAPFASTALCSLAAGCSSTLNLGLQHGLLGW
jgi:hypothetical protein